MIKVKEEILNVNIYEEVEQYLTSGSYKISNDEFITTSPFREERKPSFALNLETGLWIDWGSTDDNDKGDFIKLLSYLRNETYEEASEYLLYKYSLINPAAKLSIRGCFKEPTQEDLEIVHDLGKYLKLPLATNYLQSRGVTLPDKFLENNKLATEDETHVHYLWTDKFEKIIAVKSREKLNKRFTINSNIERLSDYLYGLNTVTKDTNTIWITESEIDALSIMAYSNELQTAVATGNGNITKTQVDKILATGVSTIVIASDADAKGKQLANKMLRAFEGKVVLYRAELKDCKDVNEYVCKYGVPKCTLIETKFKVGVNI